MNNNIFISYNPESINEKILVEGLYRKGKQNGYNLFLPERTQSNKLNQYTKMKIDSCDWFIVFSFEQLSSIVREEINYALIEKKINEKNVIVVFSQKNGINIDFGNFNPTVKFINNNIKLDKIDEFTDSILNEIVKNKSNLILEKKKNDSDFTPLKIILGIGAAALILNALSSEKK